MERSDRKSSPPNEQPGREGGQPSRGQSFAARIQWRTNAHRPAVSYRPDDDLEPEPWMRGMLWRELSFGKHRGLTLPQIVFRDPDWFFWAWEKRDNFRWPVDEAAAIYRRAQSIKVRQKWAERREVAYVTDANGKFSHLEFVPAAWPRDGDGPRLRDVSIDLSVPRQLASYDKSGSRAIVACLKCHYFGARSYKMTKERCEQFFANRDHFEEP